jgi:drug/metabolite transporter (DMT)-like permease
VQLLGKSQTVDRSNSRPRSAWARSWAGKPVLMLAVIGSILLMASSFIVAKMLLQHDVPPLLLAGWRFLLAAPIALLLILISSRKSVSDFVPSHFAVRDYATIGVIGLLQTTAAIGLLYMAMRRVSATTAAVLMFTNPIWVVTERLVMHEEAALRGRILGVILRVSGVLLAIQVGRDGFSSSSALLGDVIGLAAACCWAAATIVHRRAELRMGTWVLHFWQMLVGAIVLIGLAYLSGERWPSRLTPLDVCCFLWLAIPVSAVSFALWLFALQRSGQVHTSGFLFFVPLIAAVLSHLVLSTRLTGWQAVGGVLIGLAVWFESRSAPPEFVPPP